MSTARYPRRVQWWQGNERNAQLTCALVAIAAACVASVRLRP
jgi:hypothetical protein